MKRALVGLALVAACGDDRSPEPLITAVAGSRLTPIWYGYDDGARQLVPGRLYDLVEHAECDGGYIDGVLRCVPVADEAVFRDPACTQVVGRAAATAHPTHFVVSGSGGPAHIYQAGSRIAAVDRYYRQINDECDGPIFPSDDASYYAVAGEIDRATLVELGRDLVGSGPLQLSLGTAADGLRIPYGLIDQELGACQPATDPDGRVRCRPDADTFTTVFADADCRRPVVVVDDPLPPPTLAGVIDDAGCPTYYRVGAIASAPVYQRFAGDVCQQTTVGSRERVYETTGPLALPELERSEEPRGGRRLWQVVLSADGLTVADQRLYDSATQADCKAAKVGENLRCVPELLAAATKLYATPTCTIPADVVIGPQPLCGTPRFARNPADPAVGDLHLIGDTAPAMLYEGSNGNCFSHFDQQGTVVRALGPPLDAELFVRAVRFGER